MATDVRPAGVVEIRFAPAWRQWLAVGVGGLLAVKPDHRADVRRRCFPGACALPTRLVGWAGTWV